MTQNLTKSSHILGPDNYTMERCLLALHTTDLVLIPSISCGPPSLPEMIPKYRSKSKPLAPPNMGPKKAKEKVEGLEL